MWEDKEGNTVSANEIKDLCGNIQIVGIHFNHSKLFSHDDKDPCLVGQFDAQIIVKETILSALYFLM
jgi:hypothetical protein